MNVLGIINPLEWTTAVTEVHDRTNERSQWPTKENEEGTSCPPCFSWDGGDRFSHRRRTNERTTQPSNERTNKQTHAVVSGRQGRRRRFALRTSLRILNVSVDVVVVVVVVVLLQSEVPICLVLSSLAAQQCFSLSEKIVFQNDEGNSRNLTE